MGLSLHANRLLLLRASFRVALLVILASWSVSPSRAQLLGRAPGASTPAEEDTDRVRDLVSKLSERLTTQELNLRKIFCQEDAFVEQAATKRGEPSRRDQKFSLIAERRQVGEFSSDMQLVETHQPADAASHSIPPSDLVSDGFSIAAELLGLSHGDAYLQRLVRREKLDGRDVFVVSTQTVSRAEMRRLQIDGKSVPMRLAGLAWIEAASGNLLRLEIHQTKLPSRVREFSYVLQYATPSAATSGMFLPTLIRFTHTGRDGSIVTTQSFSACKVN